MALIKKDACVNVSARGPKYGKCMKAQHPFLASFRLKDRNLKNFVHFYD